MEGDSQTVEEDHNKSREGNVEDTDEVAQDNVEYGATGGTLSTVSRDSVASPDASCVGQVENEFRQSKAMFCRSVKRLKRKLQEKTINIKRSNRELEAVKCEFALCRASLNKLFDLVGPDDSVVELENFEEEILNEFYDVEEMCHMYVKDTQVVIMPSNSQQNLLEVSSEPEHDSKPENENHSSRLNSVGQPSDLSDDRNSAIHDSSSCENVNRSPVSDSGAPQLRQPEVAPSNPAVDAWIDELIEFKETVVKTDVGDMNLSEVLYRLEMNKDTPTPEIFKFNGDPLQYIQFIERFKYQVHDKTHLKDSNRMIILRSCLYGDAEIALSGLSHQGVMYATALKALKLQFGTPSSIARAYINMLVKGQKISRGDKEALRKFHMTMVNTLAALQQIDYLADVNNNETLRSVVMRLPNNLLNQWKNKVIEIRENGSSPSLQDIADLIHKRVKAEFDPDFGDLLEEKKFSHSPSTHSVSRNRKPVGSTQPNTVKCFICDGQHKVYECPTFSSASINERVELVKSKKLCFSCLVRGHGSYNCKRKRKCNVNNCQSYHNVLLHQHDQPGNNLPVGNQGNPGNNLPVGNQGNPIGSVGSVLDKQGILPVVTALFISPNGRRLKGNILIDSGAGTTVVSKSFAKALGLQGKREIVDLSLVGGKSVRDDNSHRVKFYVSHLSGGEYFALEAHEVDQTVENVPKVDIDWIHSFPHLCDIELSYSSGPIDLILGVQYTHLHAELEIRRGKYFEPVGKKTKLGWAVLGVDDHKSSPVVQSLNFVQKVDLRTFYEFETLGIRASECDCLPGPVMSKDDKKAMEVFDSSCKLKEDRYEIALPWKQDRSTLPNNYALAEKRLESLERSLLKNPAKAELYKGVMNEYVDKGWAVSVSSEEWETWREPVYYLPHHGVYRPDKVSTPLRVVFDPASPFEGSSLNSYLYKGPNLIGDLLGVLLRFREGVYAFTGDISKMFLQILLPLADSHVHRYLWRDLDTSRKPEVFRLTRVAFGDKPSPDMASYVLLHMAKENKEMYPLASEIIERDRYMDDLIHSCSSTQDAVEKMKQLETVLGQGSFEIKGWVCSFKDVLPSEESTCENSTSSDVSLDMVVGEKTLGVAWNPVLDVIGFSVKSLKFDVWTKRRVLSTVAGIFDPLGLASVVTIKQRMALQDIWRSKKFGWDDVLPPDLQSLWNSLFKDLDGLNDISVSRCLKPSEACGNPQMHVFVDASVGAYGAAAYLLWPTPAQPVARLISAKARVAPLKHCTIPRLELMAALVGSRLAKTIVTEFKIKPVDVVFWSDSKIVLHWIQSESNSFKAFVGARVAEIQSTWPSEAWRHVPSKENPADDLSRGLKVESLTADNRWFSGPSFLKQPLTNWPEQPEIVVDGEVETKKNTRLVSSFSKGGDVLNVESFSSWSRLVRVTAYCIRFCNNARIKVGLNDSTRISGQLLPEEVDNAEAVLFKIAQSQWSDIERRFADLAPIEMNGVIRVGGRLRFSPLEYDERHPVLLPGNHRISELILQEEHSKMGHAGSERTLHFSRRKFWITGGRNLAKKVVRNCVTCRKLKQPPHSTLMGDLPADRARLMSPPFSTTGVDFFGPFHLRVGRNKTAKAWGAVFTCATVRAVHLDVVEDLSAQSFMQCLRRFSSHHGWPSVMISDNGKTFVGTEKELRKLVVEGRKRIEEFACLHKVKWIFTTPHSPHQGGIYESLVKQTKRALKVAVGQQVLTWNEMSTVFCEVESLLNSRPLGYMHSQVDDPQPLTPNHFLIGRASTEIPQGPFDDTKDLRKRFAFVETLVNHFWKRFIKEYVPLLNKRSKWTVKHRDMEIGDIVLLVDFTQPRGRWDLAKITRVFPGSDGVVRNVEVKTKSGIYKRSIQKCCLILPSGS